MLKRKDICWKILLFINFQIAIGAIILKVSDPLRVDYTEAIKRADLLNFVIFTPIIMVIVSLLAWRSLKPIRALVRSDIRSPAQLQEIRTAAFNLPLKITGQVLLVALSMVAFVALVVNSYVFKFYPLSERALSMAIIWAYGISTSLLIYVYTRHKMIGVLKATSGAAGDIGFRMPIKARFIIASLTLSAMVFVFSFVFSFSRIHDLLWHDKIQSGNTSLISFKESAREFASGHELKRYLESRPSAENELFLIDSDGKYLTRKPSIIPDDFDIRNRLLADPEGTARVRNDPPTALRVVPLDGPFEGLYAGAVIRLNPDPAKVSKVRYVVIFFPIMGSYLLIFALIISYYVTHDTSSAVRDVTRQMVKIQDTEEVFAEVAVTSLDEVGDLTRAFNSLQRVLGSYHRQLDEVNRKLIEMERRRADHAVHDYRLLAENITDVIFTVDLNMHLTYVSPSIQRLCGCSHDEFISRGIQTWFTEDSLKAVQETFQELIRRADLNHEGRFMSRTMELEITRRQGPAVWTEARISPLLSSGGHPIGILCVLRDITERKRMEEEMLRAQKLESLGVLAGGIAHDFNNLLMSVIGNLSLIEFHAKSGHDIMKLLEATKKASWQTTYLAQQLLTFAKGGEPIRKLVPISKLLKDAVKFSLSGSSIRYELSIPDNLWGAEIDEGQINQVMNNLLINAEQAMPKDGRIEVLAENFIVQESDGLPLKEGNYVKISIRDYGTGIPEELLDKIFDPYFSTKPKGSGLGLAITYSVMKKHKGHITVESRLGVGTTFHLYLPASEREVSFQHGIPERKSHPGKGKILLMDDQSEIRDLVEQMLISLGYSVELASNGEEAIDLYKRAIESKEAFKAVILDLTVKGGMGGKEAIHKLHEIDPEVKAIVSSGYSSDTAMSAYEQYGFRGVVAKPYEIEKLSEVLSTVIQGAEK